jgi:hypothetical protein
LDSTERRIRHTSHEATYHGLSHNPIPNPNDSIEIARQLKFMNHHVSHLAAYFRQSHLNQIDDEFELKSLAKLMRVIFREYQTTNENRS